MILRNFKNKVEERSYFLVSFGITVLCNNSFYITWKLGELQPHGEILLKDLLIL